MSSTSLHLTPAANGSQNRNGRSSLEDVLSLPPRFNVPQMSSLLPPPLLQPSLLPPSLLSPLPIMTNSLPVMTNSSIPQFQSLMQPMRQLTQIPPFPFLQRSLPQPINPCSRVPTGGGEACVVFPPVNNTESHGEDQAAQGIRRRRRVRSRTSSSSSVPGRDLTSSDSVEENGAGDGAHAPPSSVRLEPRWQKRPRQEEKDKPVILTRPKRKTAPGRISAEELHQAMIDNPNIARDTIPEIVMELDLSRLSDFISPLLNKTLAPLNMLHISDKTEDEVERLYSDFKTNYIPLMEKTREAFLSFKFDSAEAAICTLTMVLRSFVVGFSVHRRESHYNADGTKVMKLQCHTLNNRTDGSKKVNQESVLLEASNEPHSQQQPQQQLQAQPRPQIPEKCSKCSWSASVLCKGDYAIFRMIKPFSLHTKECFCNFSRMTSAEVTFQQSLSKPSRAGVMRELHQTVVQPATLFQRKFRRNYAAEAANDERFKNLMEKEDIDDSISNIEAMGGNPDEEVALILRYLSYLKRKERTESFVEFERKIGNVELKSINILFEEGKRLLQSHADVLFCDSMWNASSSGYKVLTIVVVDENYNLRLLALSIVKQELYETWFTFFKWVSLRVNNLKPFYIVTDGASYIAGCFNAATGANAENIVCRWHLYQAAMRKKGWKKQLDLICIRITYAKTIEEFEALKSQARAVVPPRNDMKPGELEAKLNMCVASALVNLKHFTGGTVTNTFSESMNSVLRKAGLFTRSSILTVLRSLHNLSIQQSYRPLWRFQMDDSMRAILEEDVGRRITKGVLLRFKKKLHKSSTDCSIIELHGSTVTVQEKLSCKKSGVLLDGTVTYNVTWEDVGPKCQCNALVHSGMPCKHIMKCAGILNKKISVNCFNSRFYVVESEVPRLLPDSNAERENVDHPVIVIGDDDDDDDRNKDRNDGDGDGDNDDDDVLEDIFSLPSHAESDAAEVSSRELTQSSRPADLVPLSSIQVQLKDVDEVKLYKLLQDSADSLVELRAKHHSEKEAIDMEILLSGMADGLVLSCKALCKDSDNCPSSRPSMVKPESITPLVIQDNITTKEIRDTLHICSSNMDARYPDDEMCKFRGKLLSTIIRIIQAHRVSPPMASSVVSLFCSNIESLVSSFSNTSSSSVASVAPVVGSLNSDSYKTVFVKVKNYCIQSLLKALHKGLIISGFDALNNDDKPLEPISIDSNDDESDPEVVFQP